MNVEEALDNIVVNGEEKASIERYLGPFHTKINLLLDITPGNYEKLHQWIPKTVEELKQTITDFVNVYSTMLKGNSKSENLNNKMQLVRGTTVERISEMGEVPCGFLSITNDKEIARSFTIGYNSSEKGALLRFKLADGIPFLDTSRYIKNDLGEKEIILSPFCNIINKRFIGKTDEIDEYIVEMEPPNLQEVPKEQLQSTLDETILGYTQNIEDLKELNALPKEIDGLFSNLKRVNDVEDKIFIKQEIEKKQESLSKLRQSTNAYKDKLQNLLKGLCKQKEIEITRAREFLQQEKAKSVERMQKQDNPKDNQNAEKIVTQRQEEQRAEKRQMEERVKQQLTIDLQQRISSNRK